MVIGARFRRIGERYIDFLSEQLRERAELREEKRLLAQVRNAVDLDSFRRGLEPLVTVRIATFNRCALLAERTIPSVLAQTYRNIEILVIGDCCTDETEKVISSFKDPRLKFINLPTRGIYPEYRAYRRKVAGSHPMNVGLALARGEWIAPCDDDDVFSDDHVEVLLVEAQKRNLEMVYSKARREIKPGVWDIVGSEPLRRGHISHGSALYNLRLRFMRHSNTSWKLNLEPSDWNLWKRMKRIGVRIGFLDRITYHLYLGTYQREELTNKS